MIHYVPNLLSRFGSTLFALHKLYAQQLKLYSHSSVHKVRFINIQVLTLSNHRRSDLKLSGKVYSMLLIVLPAKQLLRV